MEDRLGAILKEYTNCVIDRDGLLAVADRLAKRQEEFFAENKRLKQVPIRLEIDDKGFGGHSGWKTGRRTSLTLYGIPGDRPDLSIQPSRICALRRTCSGI